MICEVYLSEMKPVDPDTFYSQRLICPTCGFCYPEDGGVLYIIRPPDQDSPQSTDWQILQLQTAALLEQYTPIDLLDAYQQKRFAQLSLEARKNLKKTVGSLEYIKNMI